MRIDEPGHRPPSMSQTRFDQQAVAPKRAVAPQVEPPRWDFWLYGVGLVAAVLVFASLASPWVRHEWVLSLVRQNTPYTQLGFDDASALPVTAVRGKSIPVSFVITNDEGRQVSYQYVVSSGSGVELESLGSGTKAVASGASWNVDIAVVPKCAESACRVQVSLPKQNESINFSFTYPATSKKGRK